MSQENSTADQQTSRAVAASRATGYACSAVVLVLGAAGVIGWLADLPLLARPDGGLSPMSLVTAALLCIVAVSIAALASPEMRASRRAAAALGVLAFAAGAWTLGAYLQGAPMAMDGWLLDRAAAAGLARNRMSPVSALCFVLYGTAAAAGSVQRRAAQALCSAAAAAGLLIALVSVIGYLYSIALLISWEDYKPIAPQTALALALSFLALLLARPRGGLMRTLLSRDTGGVLARRLLLFVAALPMLLGGLASIGLKNGLLTGPTSIFFLTASATISLTGLLFFNAFAINRSERARRETQQSLVDSEQAYRTLFENAADPMFLVDRDLRIVEANTAAAACLGRPAAGLRLRPVTEVAPSCARQVVQELERAFTQGSSSFESCARTVDGRDIPFEVNARAVNVRGRAAVLTIARDLSERRRAQRVLAEKDAQLRQAQKMEAIGRLAGGIAHDFNNLLTVILGYAELILGKVGPGHEARQDAVEIKMCAARAAALTRQLLAFSRRQPAAPRTIDLNEVLREMTPLLGRLIGERVRLRVEPGAGRPLLRIDPSQVEQVILNLAVNARDAMPDGGTLTIETSEREVTAEPVAFTPTPAEGRYLELSVQDTGSGIPAEIEAHIFEPFFTTKSELQGTGLGLSTVYGIVTQNGGAIGVETSARTGTTMRILFPEASGAPTEPEEERAPARAAAHRGTLLLVEDDPSVRAYLCLGLRREGFALLEAGSAEDALALVDRHGPGIDLVVSDVVMPGMGGVGLARQLANRLPGLRILFMSGYDDSAGGTIGSLCGRFDLITKPFTVSDLVAKIAEGSAAGAAERLGAIEARGAADAGGIAPTVTA